MQNDLADAVESLCDDLGDLGEEVLYEGDDNAQVRLSAVMCQPDELVDAATGEVRLEHDDQDFLIVAGELKLGGKLAEPARGHRVTTRDKTVYEVLPRSGDQSFKTCGPGRDIFQVHTKRMV